MAELSTIARPYARAVFESARAQDALAPWSEALARAAWVVADERVAVLIDNPRVLPDQLTAMVFELASAGGLSGRSEQELRNFLQLLAHNRRLHLLPEIATQFQALKADAENFATVEVRSALALTSEQSERLRSALERRLGRTVQLSASVDRTLIGGAVVRYGDFVVDGSLRRSLERMQAVISGP